mgnify:CR=1 FL=1
MKDRFAAVGVKTLIFLIVLLAIPTVSNAQSAKTQDAFAGAVEKIDAEAKLVYVRSKSGVVKAFKWTKKTTLHGIKEAELWTDRAVHIGAHVVVRTAKVAGEDIIQGLHWFGQGTVSVIETTVKHVGKGTKQVALKAADGTKEVYEVSEHAVVKTGKAIWHGFKKVEKHTEKEVRAVVHVVEKDGKKVVKYIEYSTVG